ncbi:hypothetical protein M878_40300 [Streptomyces roseochromogenus subsp. oscitans DS 12.976]|uniref:Uncharacterized protein n=1 Tax=Streptomyces roseochromogenus subsp. oscitans DS 12.976 TaxID=1352936 RepID=V6JJM8_STRRC|nr:hypothetical protein M878_40300 [Streptomyces roseochromogenus subsp. oscitans DS 12.976]
MTAQISWPCRAADHRGGEQEDGRPFAAQMTDQRGRLP